MLFHRFVDPGLAHFSYALGDGGEMVVVDPQRNPSLYIEFAKERGLKITHVLDTHIHADYASGAKELAERLGATLSLSGYDKGELYEVAYPHQEVFEGDEIKVGRVKLQALHTPGHTPEHLAYLVFENGSMTRMLSGDFLLIGSLGRPDLLGEEAKDKLAGMLYESVQTKISGLPGSLEIHPAHGAGSFCGAGMSQEASSTLGEERKHNPYFKMSRDAFVEEILTSQHPFPPYYLRMKELNAEGAPPLAQEPLKEVKTFEGKVVVDIRDKESFWEGHVKDSLFLGLNDSFLAFAPLVIPYEEPIVIVTNSKGEAEEAKKRLSHVGLDRVEGYTMALNSPLETIETIDSKDIHEFQVLDIRSEAEWKRGHLETAIHIPCHDFCAAKKEIISDLQKRHKKLALICGSGFRSTIAMSVLQRAGFHDLVHVKGGMRKLTT